MSKKTDSLRNALRGMRVSEPLRLPKSGPSFKPPATVQEPRKEVPHSEAPQSASSQSEVAQKEESPNEHPRKETTYTEVTQNEAPRSGRARGLEPQTESASNRVAQKKLPQNESAQSKSTRNEVPQMQSTQNEVTHSGAAQKEGASNELAQTEASAQPEVTQNEAPQIEQPSRGFFRLSDRAFSYSQVQELSGDCFRLFLWMSSRGWRYQNSDGTLRASVSFIENNTGMSHATISRALKTLREAKLVELQETDYKRGNLWRISPLAFAGCGPEDLPPRSEGPQNGGPRKEAPVPSKRDRSSLDLRAKSPQNEQQIRNIYKTKKLSQEGTQALLDRVSEIRAPKKQRTEKAALTELLETYSADEITAALSHVDRYGTLSGEKCHSPFRYLKAAMDDVLEACGKGAIAAAPDLIVTTTIPVDGELETSEKKESVLTAFERELTQEEREGFITRYVEREFTWGYKPSQALLRRLAAFQWHREQSEGRQAMAS